MDLICILDEPRYSNSWHKCNEVPEEVVFVASPGLDLGHPGPYRVEELLDKPFFLTERNANYRHTFDNFLASLADRADPGAGDQVTLPLL